MQELTIVQNMEHYYAVTDAQRAVFDAAELLYRHPLAISGTDGLVERIETLEGCIADLRRLTGTSTPAKMRFVAYVAFERG